MVLPKARLVARAVGRDDALPFDDVPRLGRSLALPTLLLVMPRRSVTLPLYREAFVIMGELAERQRTNVE